MAAWAELCGGAGLPAGVAGCASAPPVGAPCDAATVGAFLGAIVALIFLKILKCKKSFYISAHNLIRDACHSCLSCCWPGTPTDFEAPNRVGLIGLLATPQNPNLTFHSGNTKYVLGGLKNINK